MRVPLALEVTPRPRIRIEGQEVLLESQRAYTTAAARTTHALAAAVVPGTDGVLEVTVEATTATSASRPR